MPRRSKPLGPLISVYRQRPLRWLDLLTWGLLGLVAVLLPMLYGYYRLRYASKHFGPVAALYWSRPWYLLTTFALLTFITLVIYRIQLARRFVAVHKQGIHLAQYRRRKLHWTEIAGIASSITQHQFLGIHIRTRYYAKLFPNVGNPIHIDHSLKNLPELLTYIKANLYPRLLPLLQSNFSEGQWLHFGPILIQRRMIQIKKQQYKWSQIEQIFVDSGYLVIDTINHSRHRLPVAQVPNVEILLQLIQQEVKA